MAIAQQESKIIITGMGHYHPENCIENNFFDTLDIGSDALWISERTGIETRRSVLSHDSIRALRNHQATLEDLRRDGLVMDIATMSQEAFQLAKGRHAAHHGSLAIDGVICGTSVPDYDIPANACAIAARIGIQAVAFDVNSACSGFLMDLQVAHALLRAGSYSTLALFNPERYSLRMDYSDRKTCILFGDGCASSIVTRWEPGTPLLHGLEVLDIIMFGDPLKHEVVAMKDAQQFGQDGSVVQKFAISQTLKSTQTILERNHLSIDNIAYFSGHQANLRMVQSVATRLGLEPEQHLYNVDKFGNQGAAGAPAVLSANWGRFKPDDLIIVTVVGSGLTWGSALLRRTNP